MFKLNNFEIEKKNWVKIVIFIKSQIKNKYSQMNLT